MTAKSIGPPNLADSFGDERRLMIHHQPAAALSQAIALRFVDRDRPTLVTWLNHFTALEADAELLRRFDFVGIDGTLLQFLTGAKARTSADLVLPLLLPTLGGARVVVVGGAWDRHERPTSDSLRHALEQMGAGNISVVRVVDGYEGLVRGSDLRSLLEAQSADVVIVGLGARLQDEVAVEAAAASTNPIVLTCGGFLDQVLVRDYYPAWAYPLRLNWLVRLSREPRRLWRRYSVYVVRALRDRKRLRELALIPGVAHAEAASRKAPTSTQ